jgi:hypothetical protein
LVSVSGEIIPRETESPIYATAAHDVFAEPTCTVVDVLVDVLGDVVVEVAAVVAGGDVERGVDDGDAPGAGAEVGSTMFGEVGRVGKGPSSTGGAVE